MAALFRYCGLSKQYSTLIDSTKFGSFIFNCNINVPVIFIPSRTTMIMKRRFPVDLYKEDRKPVLGKKTQFLELEEDTENKPEPLMDVVLTSYVSGIGNRGDIISMKRSAAYNKLLLPGLASYPTPENLEYARKIREDKTVQEAQISPSVEFCMKFLKNRCILVVMSRKTPWTIEPWHVRASFRQSGVHILSDSSIHLPSQPIKGPDMNLQGKEFYVTITVNKRHKVKVRCCIHHWSAEVTERLPLDPEFWLTPGEKIFPEDNTEDSSS